MTNTQNNTTNNARCPLCKGNNIYKEYLRSELHRLVGHDHTDYPVVDPFESLPSAPYFNEYRCIDCGESSKYDSHFFDRPSLREQAIRRLTSEWWDQQDPNDSEVAIQDAIRQIKEETHSDPE